MADQDDRRPAKDDRAPSRRPPSTSRSGSAKPRNAAGSSSRSTGKGASRSDAPKRDGERKPYSSRSDGPKRDGERKPYSSRGDGERKPYSSRSDAPKRDSERKPYSSRGDGERKPYSSRGDGERKPYSSRSDAPKRDGERKPYSSRGDGERKPYSSRSDAPKRDGEHKPYSSRSDGPKRDGERKPYSSRSDAPKRDGERKPYSSRGDSRGGKPDAARRSSGGRDQRDQSRAPSRSGPRERPAAVPRIPRARRAWLAIDPDITGQELDKSTRGDLRSLTEAEADRVAKHLVMVARYVDDDPELAYQHAFSARSGPGSRLAAVREAAGVAAYRAGKYSEALTELRAAHRISGSPDLLPLIADSERGIGRPERAMTIFESAEARTLDTAGKVELLLVAAGARRDMGQPDAALAMLRIPLLETKKTGAHIARLRAGYADVLRELGRNAEAEEWLVRAVAADPDDETGVSAMLADATTYDDVEFLDLDEDDLGYAEEVDSDEDGDLVPDVSTHSSEPENDLDE